MARPAAAAPSPPSPCPAPARVRAVPRWPPTSSSWSCVVDRDVGRGSWPRRWPGRSETAAPAPRATSASATAPGRTIAQAPVVLVAPQVDHRRGDPGQLAAVDHAGRPRAASPRAPRPAAAPRRRRPGWRSTAAPATARPQAAAPRAPAAPSVDGSSPQASGNRRARVGQQHASPPRAAAAPAPTGSAARAPAAPPAPARGRRTSPPTACPAAALERVQPLDGDRVLGVAGQAVDGVGREHGDPADRHAALERRGVRPALTPRPTTTRSWPARSRTHARPRRSRPSRSSAATAAACAGPISSADQPRSRPAADRHQPADHIEPVGAGEQRRGRLVARDLRGQRSAVAHVGQVGQHRVVAPVVEQVATPNSTVEPQPRGVGARHRHRIRATTSRPRHVQVRPLVLRAPAPPRRCPCRRRPRAPRRQLEPDLDQQLGLRPGDQHPPVDGQRRAAGTPCAPGCRRPARAPPAARAALDSRASRRRPAPRRGRAPAARARRRALGQQQLGVQPRACRSRPRQLARPEPSAAADRDRPHRRAPQPPAFSSRRRRFSSSWSASVSSSSSPIRIPSRLWTAG